MADAARSAVLTEPRQFVIESAEPASPGPGQVRVRVEECGICGSDLKMYAGDHPVHTPPLLLGHELVGVVDRVGEGTSIAVGTEVVAYPAIGCGECHACRRGREELCPRMRLIGGHERGGLSEYVVMPERNAILVDPGVPPDQRVLVEPMAVAVHGVARASLEPGERVLVLGAGPIGIFTAMVLRAASVARLVVVDLDPGRLEVASRLGFEAYEGGSGEPAELLERVRDPEGFEAVFDCAGGAGTPDFCLRCATPGGRLVMIGVPPREISFDSLELQRAERSVLGSMMYSRDEFGEAMRLLGSGVAADAASAGLLRETFALEHVAEAFAALAARETPCLKIVVSPGPTDGPR